MLTCMKCGEGIKSHREGEHAIGLPNKLLLINLLGRPIACSLSLWLFIPSPHIMHVSILPRYVYLLYHLFEKKIVILTRVLGKMSILRPKILINIVRRSCTSGKCVWFSWSPFPAQESAVPCNNSTYCHKRQACSWKFGVSSYWIMALSQTIIQTCRAAMCIMVWLGAMIQKQLTPYFWDIGPLPSSSTFWTKIQYNKIK